MKKVLMSVFLTAVMLLSTALTGCKKEKDATTPEGEVIDKTEEVTEEVAKELPEENVPVEKPMPETPLDHPAH